MKQFYGFLFYTLFLYAPRAIYSADQSEEISRCIKKHVLSRDLIETLSCKSKLVYNSLPNPGKQDSTQNTDGDFKFGRKNVRAKVIERNQYIDSVWTNGHVDSIIYMASGGQNRVRTCSRTAISNQHWSRCDPFRIGLLAACLPYEITAVGIERLLEKAHKATLKSALTDKGQPIEILTLFFETENKSSLGKTERLSSTIQIDFDPLTNNLAKKITYSDKSNGPWLIMEVTQFKEFKNGIFFPVEGKITSIANGNPIDFFKVIISDVIVNEPFEDDAFSLSFPEGSLMVDELTKTSYRIDQFGNPISEQTVSSAQPPPPIGKTLDSTYTEPSTEESPGWPLWPLGLSVAILFAGLGIYFYKK